MKKAKEEQIDSNGNIGGEEIKLKNKHFTKNLVRMIIFGIVLVISLVSLVFKTQIEDLLNHNYFYSPVLTDMDFKVHFIDVGEGDCSVIELNDGRVMMIDTGPKDKWNKINTYFEYLKIPKKIDYLVLTHTDNDHIGNAEKLIDNFEVKNVYLPMVYSNYEVSQNLNTNSNYKVFNNSVWNNLCYKIRTTLKEENIIYTNQIFCLTNDSKEQAQNYSIYIFPPQEEYYKDDNKYSPFIWAKIGCNQVLFTGDADKEREKEIFDDFEAVLNLFGFKIDILKVGHHGSNTSSSLEFLEKVKPNFAVISCGRDNTYGHPSNETINNLKQVNSAVSIYETDLDNSVMFRADENYFLMVCNYEHFDDPYFYFSYLITCVITISFVLLVLPIILKRDNKNEV